MPSPKTQRQDSNATPLTTVCLYALSFHSLAYHYTTVTTLRTLSQRHNRYHNRRSPRTFAASAVYNSIPVHFRQMIDRLVQAKGVTYSDRENLAYLRVKKSDILAFLAPYLLQPSNPALELLRTIEDVEVIDIVSGELVPMFVEG